MSKPSTRGSRWFAPAFLVTATCVFWTLGCFGESVEIKNTVRAYNEKLSEALGTPDPSCVAYVASSEEQKRVQANMAFITKDKVLLITELVELEFGDVSRSEKGDSATVETRERWRKHLIDARTRKPLTAVRETGERNIYHLLRTGHRWVVDRVEPLGPLER